MKKGVYIREDGRLRMLEVFELVQRRETKNPADPHDPVAWRVLRSLRELLNEERN